MRLSKYASYFVSEFLCTALLVSFTCASRVALQDALIPMSISYGLINLFLTSCFAEVSGAYANPAVVLALWWRGGISTKRFFIYTAAEISGTMAGHFGFSKILDKITGDSSCVLNPKPGLTDSNIMGAEILLTFLLVMTWCLLWEYESKQPMEWYLGCANTLIYLMGAYLTGASTNPAKTVVHMLLIKKNQTALLCIAGQLLAGLAAPFLLGFLQYMME